MKSISKSMVAIAGAALVMTGFAAPADAQRRWRHHHHDNDIDAGDVVTGVAVVGGIAAIASAITQGNRAKQDAAVDDCAVAAERRLGGEVTDIGGVTKKKGYYTVDGIVDLMGEPGGYGRGSDTFVCTVRNGRIYSFHAGSETR